MSLKDVDIKIKYKSSKDRKEILNDFYIPVLTQAKEYYRVAGFFSSTSLIIASKGIEGLIKNNGKMKLLVSPKLSEQDYYVIKESTTNKLNSNLEMFSDFENEEFPDNDNLKALAWMLKNGTLEIKIVIGENNEERLFHEKFGIFKDEHNDLISFSGSINESANGWLNNIEEFKTFKSWVDGQAEYLYADLKEFNSYWYGNEGDLVEVYELPESIERKIIETAPQDINDLKLINWNKEVSPKENNNELSLFKHQLEAVEKWKANDYKLLMEMATGTGKTRTAIGCILELLKSEKKLFVVVSTPQNTLSLQWKDDLENLGIGFEVMKIIDGTNHSWKNDLEKIMLNIKIGYSKNAIIFTTHVTSSNDEFIKRIKNNCDGLSMVLVCDEVHGTGSEHQRNALLDCYQYRIGLSATPERMYDEEGSSLIRQYFGNLSYEFTIADALNTINPLTNKPFLNNFYYYPVFVTLTDDEQKKYNAFSKQIALEQQQEHPDKDKIESLLMNRAKILKNADNKLEQMRQVLLQLSENEDIKDTIIFSPEQKIDNAMTMLSNMNITRCKVTEEESSVEKANIINNFRNGNFQVLLGIKCLDEGIDITNARIALLLASSTNPREYVQRVGRVIRTGRDKKASIIYDFVVCSENYDDKILEKEAKRSKAIAINAINWNEVIDIFKNRGVDISGN